MTPAEFEENARIISGDLTWSLVNECINPRQAAALAEVGGPLPALCWAVLTLPEHMCNDDAWWQLDASDD